MTRVGIIGAGIAGLSCAQRLAGRGWEVVLFDKGRGPGGRMSTRRIQTPEGQASFDHGAQYFTVRSDDFRDQVNGWIDAAIVAPWPAAGTDAHVGVPAMNAPVTDLAARHVVHWSTRVVGLRRHGECWRLSLENGDAREVDLVVIAVPAEQAAVLLADVAAGLAGRARAAVSDPCWAVMAAFAEPVAAVADCWRGQGAVGWAARNSAKPGRAGPEAWVVQATPEWSREYLEADPTEVAAGLLGELPTVLGVELPPHLIAAAHRWRFARSAPGGSGPVFDVDRRLGVCGDWLIGPRVESAWLSGAALAAQIGR